MSAAFTPMAPGCRFDSSVATKTRTRRQVVVDRLPTGKKSGRVTPESIANPSVGFSAENASKGPENGEDSAKGMRAEIGLVPFSAAAARISFVMGDVA